MPTNITQMEDVERGKTVLRVSGELMLSDAELLERIAVDLRETNGKNLTLDLADLSYMDSDAASIIKRLETERGFEVEGLQFFLQKAVEEAEKRHTK